MAFLAERLDPRITRGAQKTLRDVRIPAYTQSGQLVQRFVRPVWPCFDVAHGLRSADDFHAVQDAFWVLRSPPYYEGLLFKDWSDFEATPANSTLTFLTGATWQLGRLHRFGAATYARPIRRPLAGTVTIHRTRGGVVSTASATIDYATGIATISGHVGGDTYTWTGEFDVPVTFTADEWSATYEGSTKRLFMVSGSIKLEEVKP